MNEIFNKLHRTGTFTTEWYHIKLNGNSGNIIFRIVVDGRTDMYGRLIRRYEGSIVDSMGPDVISILEKCLLEVQNETNNYNYGFTNSIKQENDALENEKKSIENCQIELTGNKIIIKSDILVRFLQEHSYADLLKILTIESNDLEEHYKI